MTDTELYTLRAAALTAAGEAHAEYEVRGAAFSANAAAHQAALTVYNDALHPLRAAALQALAAYNAAARQVYNAALTAEKNAQEAGVECEATSAAYTAAHSIFTKTDSAFARLRDNV